MCEEIEKMLLESSHETAVNTSWGQTQTSCIA